MNASLSINDLVTLYINGNEWQKERPDPISVGCKFLRGLRQLLHITFIFLQ